MAFSDNHVGLTEDSEFSGMHRMLTLRPQAGDPATTADEVAIYNKLVSTIPEMFFRPSNNQTPIQMTYPSISTGLASTNPDVAKMDQYTFSGGPFIIYFGFMQNPVVNSTKTLTPGASLLYVSLSLRQFVDLVPGFSYNIQPIDLNLTPNSFKIYYDFPVPSGGFDVWYFAIGL